jgi:hypothetical protein
MTTPRSLPELVGLFEAALAQPTYFSQLLARAEGHRYRDILLAWSDVRSRRELARDEHGRYWLPAGDDAQAVQRD